MRPFRDSSGRFIPRVPTPSMSNPDFRVHWDKRQGQRFCTLNEVFAFIGVLVLAALVIGSVHWGVR